MEPAAELFRLHMEPALAAAHAGLPGLPELAERQLSQLCTYLSLVQQYNKVAGLTALRDLDELAEELAADSLRLLALGELKPDACVVDLGSGNGSPIVPLAIACPGADCHACESSAKKAAFLRRCAVLLKLANLGVLEQRAETLDAGCAGGIDVLTSRAFAPLPVLLPLAAGLLDHGGEMRGYLGADTLELQDLAPQHGFEIEHVMAYSSSGKPRHLYALRRL